ncbi:MAG TPA: M90 family metallopeptidase, partial [Flavipsychrobacter sp.]|nr:M90 family metallopeptidase [Flavipsychrobacter sp.]
SKVAIIVLAITEILFLLFRSWAKRKAALAAYQLPPVTRFLLYNYVPFYVSLSADEQQRFEQRMRDFLARTKITGVAGVTVYDVDLVFLAAAAVIPLFGHPEWRYNNLNEILLYGDTFNRQYDVEGPGRDVLGLVGEGVLHRQMILSQPALRAGFLYPENAHNTALHEFVHLIDKADGAIDGVPQYLLDKNGSKEWRSYMQTYIRAIKEGYTDINPYGATNEAEFFAVISEYYFKQPQTFRFLYPELYEMLNRIYAPKAAA